jgi:hypothetical protein
MAKHLASVENEIRETIPRDDLLFRFMFNLHSWTPDIQPLYKCIDAGSLTVQSTLYLEPVLHHRLLTMSISTAKVTKWFPRLCSFLSNNTRGPATPEPLSVPGSLRDTYEAACAWFLGPKAENADYLKVYVEVILNDLIQCRRNLSQDDEVRISSFVFVT